MPVQLIPIEAHERTIGQIFDDTYAFEIPAYQRPYAWEVEQASQLLTDLIEAMDDYATSGGVYFLGSIVLIKLPNDPQSKVIDGQQRLTTLTILLSVLRDLTSDNEKRFDRRRYIFQKANSDRGTSDRFRVLLRQRDRPFFLKTVQQAEATNALPETEQLAGSQRLIAANARYFREQLELLSEEKRDALIAFIIQRCYLVVVAVPTAEAARRIFTVLNARGLDLTPTDILKADLLDRAGDASEQVLADRWESVEQASTREGMVELFGHIRMIYEREKPRLALEVAFPKFVKPFQEGADKFISTVLEPISDAFLLLRDDKEIKKIFGPEAAKAVRSLGRIDNKDWLPPALLKLWRRKPGEHKPTAEFLIKLERLAYYLFVTRAGVNDRIKRFAMVINDIDPHGSVQGNGLDLTDFEEAEFINELDGNLYLKSRVCKPVLQRLDEALSTGGASYDELVSIEHVLPQKVDLNSEWATLFPEDAQRSVWTHRLANLVFLTHRVNTRASNWDFEEKKSKYFSSEDGSSPFVITQEVLQADKWTPEYLGERQVRLIKKLAEVWQLDLSKTKSREAVEESYSNAELNLSAAKRESIMRALGKREGIDLVQKTVALYSNLDGDFRAVCSISKRYPTGRPYWYGYMPQWDAFLSGAKVAFFVVGFMDQNRAYAIPHARISKLLQYLHRTADRHWHLDLEENANGQIELITKSGSKVGLTEFEITFDA